VQRLALAQLAGDFAPIGRIGEVAGGPVDFLNGAADQVHVYDRALSDADVSALYTSGK
jgi:hypothetical protein